MVVVVAVRAPERAAQEVGGDAAYPLSWLTLTTTTRLNPDTHASPAMRRNAFDILQTSQRLHRAGLKFTDSGATPVWHAALLSHPPAPPLPIRKNMVRPIAFPEDKIREQFFTDFPFEAFRAKSITERERIQPPQTLTGKAWWSLSQVSLNPTSDESVVTPSSKAFSFPLDRRARRAAKLRFELARVVDPKADLSRLAVVSSFASSFVHARRPVRAPPPQLHQPRCEPPVVPQHVDGPGVRDCDRPVRPPPSYPGARDPVGRSRSARLRRPVDGGRDRASSAGPQGVEKKSRRADF